MIDETNIEFEERRLTRCDAVCLSLEPTSLRIRSSETSVITIARKLHKDSILQSPH
jgi:hypothetical protein